MDVSGQLHVPAALPPGTHWIGGWVGPTAGLDAVEKRIISCLCRESNPDRPVQSSEFLMGLASTVVLGFGPRWDPWPYFLSFHALRVLKWGLLFEERLLLVTPPILESYTAGFHSLFLSRNSPIVQSIARRYTYCVLFVILKHYYYYYYYYYWMALQPMSGLGLLLWGSVILHL
jgi:hypothetical protein